jgi:3-oxoacid CoA-transferase
MVGGYGKLGAPLSLLNAVCKTPVKDLTVVCSSVASPDNGSAIQDLLENKKISKLITSSVDNNTLVKQLFENGELEIDLLPMGTLAEKVRSGGFGIPAFFSPVGLNTFHEEGGIPTKLSKNGVVSKSTALKRHNSNGKDYLLERTLLGDYSLVRAWKADTMGNCVMKLARRNFNPDMAFAGKVCIVEAEEIVEPGKIDGDDVNLSNIFVHRVIKAPNIEPEFKCNKDCFLGQVQELMAKRAAQEIKAGDYVILNSGLPRFIEQYMNPTVDVHYVYPETGIFGGIRKPPHITGALDGSMRPLGLHRNGAIVAASYGFTAIRGGHVNKIFTEAYQVSMEGDLANIEKGDKFLPSPGVQMDLATAAYKTPLIALMELETNGKCNLVKKCEHKVSGRGCVSKLITDAGVFQVKKDGMHLVEVAPGVKAEDIKKKIPFKIKINSNLKTITT